MSYCLRFQLYTDPSRNQYNQLGEDILLDELPQFRYGQYIRAGDDQVDKSLWTTYVVANLTHLKQENDYKEPGRSILLIQVYLADVDQWPLFGPPPGLSREVTL